MIDISVFFVDGHLKDGHEQSVLVNNNVFYQPRNLINKNTNPDYNINVKDVSIEDVPQNVKSDLVIFLDNSLYVKENFIDTAVNHAKIFDDYGLLCGPVDIDKNNKQTTRSIYEYDLNFYGSKVSDITGEPNNYPSIIGSVLSGEAYNRIAYTPTQSKRHKSFENYYFLEMLSKRFKIYYTDSLVKYRVLTNKDERIENISKKYYDDGYQAGSVLFNTHSDNKILELWHRFVQSPESFDYNCPRWLMREVSTKSTQYLEDLIVLRCQYQIGFYEGMTNKILI